PGASSASPDAATSSHDAGMVTWRGGASGSAAANTRRIRTPRQVAVILRWVFMGRDDRPDPTGPGRVYCVKLGSPPLNPVGNVDSGHFATATYIGRHEYRHP